MLLGVSNISLPCLVSKHLRLGNQGEGKFPIASRLLLISIRNNLKKFYSGTRYLSNNILVLVPVPSPKFPINLC